MRQGEKNCTNPCFNFVHLDLTPQKNPPFLFLFSRSCSLFHLASILPLSIYPFLPFTFFLKKEQTNKQKKNEREKRFQWSLTHFSSSNSLVLIFSSFIHSANNQVIINERRIHSGKEQKKIRKGTVFFSSSRACVRMCALLIACWEGTFF